MYGFRLTKILFSLAILLVSSSCTNGTSTITSESSRVSISIYSFDRQDYKNNDDRVLAYIEDQTGVDIEIQTGVWDDSQMDVLMASGDYPDVITIVDSDNFGRFNKWVHDGKLVPFTEELIKGLPYLTEVFNNSHLQSLRINGQFYGLPLKDEFPSDSPGQHVFIIREDWLNKLQLEMPQTLENFVDILTAFKENDPDGNGMSDSYGLLADGLDSIVESIVGAWGIPTDKRSTGFLQVGDHYEYWAIQPEVKEALQYVKKLYNQKLIHPDTLSASSNVQIRPRFVEGRTGVLLDSINFEELIKKQEQLQRHTSSAALSALPALAGPNGKRGYSAGSGYWGYTVITDKSENPRAVAELLNYLLSEEGTNVTLYGVPEVHYTHESGKLILNLEERSKDIGFRSATEGAPHELNWGIVSWSRMTEEPYLQLRDQKIANYSKIVRENLDSVRRYIVYPAAYHIVTPEWISFKANSDQLQEEYFNKIISGQLELDAGFAEYISKWKNSGGEKAMKAMSDAIQATQ